MFDCSAVQSGSLLIDSSTVDPATSQEIEKQAASKEAVYMDSPVSGGTLSLTVLHLLQCSSLCPCVILFQWIQFMMLLLPVGNFVILVHSKCGLL